MKIKTIHNRVRLLAALAAVCGVFMVAGTQHAAAQSTLLDYLTSGDKDKKAAFAASKSSEKMQVNGKQVSVISASDVPTAASAQGRISDKGAMVFQAAGNQPTATAPTKKPESQPAKVQPASATVASASGSISDLSGRIRQVGCMGGSSCQSGSCGGGCRSTGGYGNLNGRSSYGGQYLNPCGVPCDPYCYVLVEGLYMQRRGDSNFTFSNLFSMGEFDYELGPRITVGSLPDCVHGYEATLTGPIEWDREAALTFTDIDTFLRNDSTLLTTELSSFNDATFQSQRHEAEYWSLDANKTLVGWDVAKLLIGARYINYDEDYGYFSTSATGNGSLLTSVENQMIGLQVGMDLLYPIAKFAYADFRGRAGGYLNFADASVQYSNADALVFSNSSEDEQIAGVFEIGSGLLYQLGEALALRAGTELWYITGIATATDQVPGGVLSRNSGRSVRADDDIVVFGLTVGAELRW